MRVNKIIIGIVLGVLVSATGCTTDGSTPTMPLASEAEASYAAMSTSENGQLNAQLEREKARISKAQEASKPTYDALKKKWQRFLDSTPDKARTKFVVCDPIQYVADVKIIGPKGGEIGFGPHKLYIPQGALSRHTVVTAEGLTSLNVEAKFSPHGLLFNTAKPAKLELSYKHCFGLRSLGKKIVYVDNNHVVVEYPITTDVKNQGLVWARIGHFSSYMIAY